MPPATAGAATQPHQHPGRHPGPHCSAKPKLDKPCRPERTVLYRIVAGHCEIQLALCGAGQFEGQRGHRTPACYVEQALRKYLEYGIFAHGFARVWCNDCDHDYFVAYAYACKGHGVCPSYDAHMALVWATRGNRTTRYLPLATV